MVLYQGRPENTAGRAEKELRVYDLLDSLGIGYLRVDHGPAMTMEACREVDQALGTRMCKNLLLCNRQKTDWYLLMLPGEKNFKTSSFSRAIGSSRLSFAPGEDMERLLGITPGSLTVMGLMNDEAGQVQLVIDQELLEEEYLGVHPCVNTASIRVKLQDLLDKVLPALHHSPKILKAE